MDNTEFNTTGLRTFEVTEEQYEQCEKMLYMYSDHYKKQHEITGYYGSSQHDYELRKQYLAGNRVMEEYKVPALLLMKLELFAQWHHDIAHDKVKRKRVFASAERAVIRIVETE